MKLTLETDEVYPHGRLAPKISGSIQAWFDGSCTINPGGTAKYGMIIKVNGEIVHSASGVVGTGPKMSNNVAEYAGVVAVLEYLVANRVTGKVTIFGDSLIVISKLTKGRVSNGLCRPYSEMAVYLKQQLTCTPELVWIPREQNSEADELSR
ncbi:MAG: ribonuclease [Blastocatellia bacterium]|jgi:ribonuclease HI|nr:ribonuclease [Blastocatellia bacterium]